MTDKVYCYPPEFDVLINKADLRDQKALDQFERLNARSRFLDIPLNLPTNEPGYREIHRRVFQDVYSWAGTYRTVNISKGNTEFALSPFIGVNMKRVFGELQAEKNLKNLKTDKFAYRAAVYLDDINHIHCFRDGNGRSQRLFLRNLAHQAGHELKLNRIKSKEWMNGAIKSLHQSDYKPMATVIEKAITGRSHKQDNDIERP